MDSLNAEIPSAQGLLSLQKPLETLWLRAISTGFRWEREIGYQLERRLDELGRYLHDSDDAALAEWASQLHHHVLICLGVGRAILPSEEHRFHQLFEAFRQSYHERCAALGGAVAVEGKLPIGPEGLLERSDEIFIIGVDASQQLAQRLLDAGYRIRYLPDLLEADSILASTLPQALLVHVEDKSDNLAGLRLVQHLHTNPVHLQTPVIFITAHDTLDVRLEAVKVGGVGYFTRPFDPQALIGKLGAVLTKTALQTGRRALLITASAEVRQRYTHLLKAHRLDYQICEPKHLLDVLTQFRPALILLDIDHCAGVDGLQLAGVLRQHHFSYAVPLLLLCRAEMFNDYLDRISRDGDDLLADNLPDTYVGWVLERRLQRSLAVNNRLTALHNLDSASGLYNRRYFLEQMEQTLNQTEDKAHVAVMLIMLRNWRTLRDRLELSAADELIVRIARRLRKLNQPGMVQGRVGEALFAVLLTANDHMHLVEYARRLHDTLAGPAYRLGEQTISVEPCVGIGVASDSDHSYEETMQRADFALSVARDSQGEHIHLRVEGGAPGMEAAEQTALLNKIVDAVRHQRMRLLFQPVASLRGDRTPRYEVLLRLRDSEGEELLAESVFTLAQRSSKLGLALDRWVVTQAINLLTTRKDARLFIHLSMPTLQDPEWLKWLAEKLAASHIDAKNLVFGLSEMHARAHKDLQPFRKGLQELHCRFALSRFGRQRDSFELVRKLNPDFVKLDPQFVRDLNQSVARATEAKQVLKDWVERLQEREVQVIVSGIEELHTLPALWSCGADLVQGFFLQRPHEEMNYDFAGGML